METMKKMFLMAMTVVTAFCLVVQQCHAMAENSVAATAALEADMDNTTDLIQRLADQAAAMAEQAAAQAAARGDAAAAQRIREAVENLEEAQEAAEERVA